MKRGPKPLGDKAMTGAERQARYRAAHNRRHAAAYPLPQACRPAEPGAEVARRRGRAAP
jgi:hypothetical protein